MLNWFGDVLETHTRYVIEFLRHVIFPILLFSKLRKVLNHRLYGEAFFWGREIIARGSRWRIGDGNDVKVLEDPWLPRPLNFKVFDLPYFPHSLYAVDLKLGNGDWDEHFIRLNFYKEDADLILSMPTDGCNLRDKIMWHY